MQNGYGDFATDPKKVSERYFFAVSTINIKLPFFVRLKCANLWCK